MYSSLLVAALLYIGTARSQQSCNGSPSLCDRLYSNITLVGAHDSAFVGFLPTENQYTSVSQQLGSGIRFLQAQTHLWNGGIEMCHTSCVELNAGSLATYLTPVKTFLDANPDEVVTMLLTNGDAIPVSQFAAVFKSVGLDLYAFAPSQTLALADWPTLGSLIDQGRRLIVFMGTHSSPRPLTQEKRHWLTLDGCTADYHADPSHVPFILDEFAYFFETPFDTTDKNFAECTLDRPAGASPDGRMYIVNHFLDLELDIFGEKILIPDQLDAQSTNSISSILVQSNLCLASYGRLPNAILVGPTVRCEMCRSRLDSFFFRFCLAVARLLRRK